MFQTIENFRDPAVPHEASAVIGKVHSMTMSPVMNVTILTASGVRGTAVLKLYDHRFGTSFRDFYGDYSPHTPTSEATFHSFIQTGKAEAFLHELSKEREPFTFPTRPSDFLDDPTDGIARFETALWKESQDNFNRETEAYRRLAGLQGKAIPRMYAHVRLIPLPGEVVSSRASDKRIAPYVEVKGILLERIDGYNLWDLPSSPIAPLDPTAWQGIVQAAVNKAEAIDRSDVLMWDCSPRNVVVNRHTQTPFIIDLADCGFRDGMVKRWEKIGPEVMEYWDEGKKWCPEAHWWEQVYSTDNPGAIGSVMANRIRRKRGVELQLKYPDYNRICTDLRARGPLR